MLTIPLLTIQLSPHHFYAFMLSIHKHSRIVSFLFKMCQTRTAHIILIYCVTALRQRLEQKIITNCIGNNNDRYTNKK